MIYTVTIVTAQWSDRLPPQHTHYAHHGTTTGVKTDFANHCCKLYEILRKYSPHFAVIDIFFYIYICINRNNQYLKRTHSLRLYDLVLLVANNT